jgi:crotonobetainyl-CoA:carnitine CoA-transferase CaiB-like acyl-CoA transferase
VVVSIRAFGSEGAWADRPGYDMVLQAQGGAMSITGAPGDAPLRCGLPVADLLAGLQAAQAATLGLLHRERTGAGQHVVVNMMQVASAALVYHGARALLTGEVEERRGNAHRGLVPYERYACSDGHLVVACGNDALFAALSEALGLPDVPAWRTNAGRVSRRGDVDAAVAGALVGLTVEEADRLLADAGVPAAAVRDVGEAAHHPAVRTARVRHPELGDIELPGPWLYTADTVLDPRPPPALGAHGDEVLAEVGYAPDEVGRLAALGAFGRHDR